MEVFLSAYGLSTKEGVALMCLAEALLRVPDTETMDELIRDKIAPHDWSAHSGGSASIFVNASTWALMLTGRVLDEGEGGIEGTLRAMVRRLGEPVIRTAVAAAMREMGEQFVLGRTIAEAVKRGRPMTAKGYLYSYDMLGEAARTEADALRYLRAYADAIVVAGRRRRPATDIRRNPGISVKLSALHPRYEQAQKETMLPVMAERLLALALAARHARMGLNIDAEEADRLDLSLDVIERVLAEPELAGWNGFGVVVQAYGPRAAFVIDWLHALAKKLDRRIMVRLVKGAYWDTEIKRAQTLGLDGYPVFTRKANTDVSYIACARKLLSMTDRIYPQFATHNAHTVAAVLAMARRPRQLRVPAPARHGRGSCTRRCARPRARAAASMRRSARIPTCSPIWCAGCSRTAPTRPSSTRSPTRTCRRKRSPAIRSRRWRAQGPAANPAIAKPAAIFGAAGSNSQGLRHHRSGDAGRDRQGQGRLSPARSAGRPRRSRAPPATASTAPGASTRPRPNDVVGTVTEASAKQVATAVRIAVEAQPAWAKRAGRRARRDPAPRRRPLRGATPSNSSRWPRARPARRWPTASPKCARRSTSCAITRPRRRTPKPAPRRAARSSASRRGIFRWRSSPARSRPRSSPAMRSSPSRPSRRR